MTLLSVPHSPFSGPSLAETTRNAAYVGEEYKSLLVGLVDGMIANDGAGNPLTLSGLQLIRSGASWDPSFQKGMGIRSDAANERTTATSLALHRISFPVTIAFFFHQIGATPTFDNHFGVSHNNTDTNPWWAYGIGGNGTDTIYLQYNDGGSPVQPISTETWSMYAGLDVLAIGVVASGDQRLILNGNTIVSAAVSSIAGPQYGSTSQVEFGGQTGTSGRYSNNTAYAWYIWDRVLSDGEMQLLRADPFWRFRLDYSQFWGKAAAATPPAGGFFARRYYDEFLAGAA